MNEQPHDTDTDAFAETQLLPKLTVTVPEARKPAHATDQASTAAPADAAGETAAVPIRPSRHAAPSRPEEPAKPSEPIESAVPDAFFRPQEPSVPAEPVVPDSFFRPQEPPFLAEPVIPDAFFRPQEPSVPAEPAGEPTTEPETTNPASPASATGATDGHPDTEKAPAPKQPRGTDAAAKQTGHEGQASMWRESVPFDETGVLLRPEMLRHRAMVAETELISAIKLEKVPEEGGSEAVQAQQPGFWTGAWPRRAMVAVILLVQALLSLRNNNTAFEDEALYLYSGHLELGHLLYGTSTGANFWSYFSGAPTLYPVLGSVADQIGGLFAARLLNLAFMLGVTGLLYLLSKRLFGTRAGLCAAGLYCCGEATVFLGGLATYDAPALFLLALSAWIVVRYAESTWPVYLAAALPLTLAVGTKYAALMFVPGIIVLALLTSLPKSGAWAWIRPVGLSAGVALLLYTALKIAGPTALTGVETTTTNRAQGTDSASLILKDSAEWSGVVFLIALVGAWFLIRLPQGDRHAALPTARWQRVCLALLLAGTALLAPAYQLHLHTAVSLQKHVGFGLFFAAPLAGYGLVRLVGPNFHRVQIGICVAVLTFALGMGQSLFQFHVWPNSAALVDQILRYQKPNGHYLVSSDEVEIYSMRGDADAEPDQFVNTFFFGYVNSKGQYITGNAAYEEAIAAGYFQVIAYSGTDDPVTEQMIAAQLYHNPNYREVAQIPEPTSYGMTYYYVWVHQ